METEGKLRLGMTVTRKPETVYDSDLKGRKQQEFMRGTVCYIHPRDRYHTVAFDVHGVIIRESFSGVAV